MKHPASGAAPVVAVALACAFLLALPGQTVTTKYVNDLFIFLDGAHRVTLSQVPNRDFHTALGPLNYYVPAIGYWLTGNLGGAMPVGMAVIVTALTAPAAHIVLSRLRPALGLPLAAFLILIAAVPINLGESISALSFAMFYNRIGWASLGFLLLMYLWPERHHAHQGLVDALCAAFLVLLMLYTKASYGVVGLVFLMFMLLDHRQRGWAGAALALVLGTGLLVEAFWRGAASHLADLILAGRVSGGFISVERFVQIFLRNLADHVLFVVFVVLALARTRSLRDLLFYGLCVTSGFMIINQNYQNWGIITLAAGAAVAAETLLRDIGTAGPNGRRSVAAGAPFLLLALLLPTIIHNGAALALHAGLALTQQGHAFALPNFDRVKLVKLWTDGRYSTFARYLTSLEDGAQALASLGEKPSHVLVLDFVGPFSAGLGLEPPRGDSTWHHWGRTINETNFLPPEQLFQDVRIVMDPIWPIERGTADGLRRVYAEYLAEHFELVKETMGWRIYHRRMTDTLSQSIDVELD